MLRRYYNPYMVYQEDSARKATCSVQNVLLVIYLLALSHVEDRAHIIYHLTSVTPDGNRT